MKRPQNPLVSAINPVFGLTYAVGSLELVNIMAVSISNEMLSMHADQLRRDFPITENYIFFNHASVSPIPRVAVEALEEYARYSSRYALMEGRMWEKVGAARSLFAEKIACDTSEVALTQNTTTGIALVANGLDWRPGDNVVLANIEFPSNVYPWWTQEQRGVELKWVQPVDGRLTLEGYQAAVDDRTRALAVSHVQFSTGYRADLDALGAFCKERGLLLVVDAIQSCGAITIDVKRMQISALACGAHKWLICPPGIGFFYCEKELCEKLKVWSPGAGSVVNASEYTSYDLTYADGAARFEGSSKSLPGACALEAVLKMMAEAGQENIQARIKHLTDRLCTGLEQQGYSIFSPRGDREWSGIVVFDHKEHPADQLVAMLTKRKIITCLRGGRVRVSPHFYNTDEQIDSLLAALP